MIGARGASHKESDEHVHIKLDDSAHPLVRAFGSQPFDYRDEFFRVGAPYSRDRLRILLSIDTNRTDVAAGPAHVMRQDHDYALAWIRNYGRGRVFYSTIAHNPYVFWDPRMLRFYLDAVQFALGDLPAPTTPSARLTPSVRAEEALGWKLGVEAYTFHKFTFFDTVDRTAKLGIPYIGGLSFQKVGGGINKDFAPDLSDDELRKIRLKMEEAGVRLLTYYIHDLPADETACRKIFDFGRKMGIETFMSEPKVEALDNVEKLCEEYGIRVGLHNHDQKASPAYWSPDAILKVCEGRSDKLGAAADIGYWVRAGIDPIEGVKKLGKRLLSLQLHDLDKPTADGQDVPWGTGATKTLSLLRELKASGATPTMIGLEYSKDFDNPLPAVTECRDFYYQAVLDLK
jgi:sugar phosphate isomerase/epimerase